MYEPLCGIICANLPLLYNIITTAVKSVMASYGSLRTEESTSSTSNPAERSIPKPPRKPLSMHSEWAMQSENEKDDYSTALRETQSNQKYDIEMTTGKESPVGDTIT